MNKNSYLLHHCRSMPLTCCVSFGIQYVLQWHKWMIVTVQAIYLRKELVESMCLYYEVLTNVTTSLELK
jgi:hypothetical protein